MDGLSRLRAWARGLQDTLAHVREARFFRDRLSVALVAGALIVNCLNFVALALAVRPSQTSVPTHYSNLGGGFDVLGPWYFPFLIGLFALVVTLVNGALAYSSFGRSRLASFFLLAGSGVVALFSFIISMAFGGVQ